MEYSFSIKVMVDGTQFPIIEFPENKFHQLNNMVSVDLVKSTGVKEELDNINLVLHGKIESYSFADNDWCILDVNKEETCISNGFDEYEPIVILTSELQKIFTEWLEFLNIYESNKIPFLTYNRG